MKPEYFILFGLVLVVLISGCVQEDSDKPVEVQYKGVWLPAIPPNWLASDIHKIKDLGINMVSLGVVFVEEDGNPVAGINISHIVEDIQAAHENGIKVMLSPQFKPPQPKLEEIDVEVMNSLIIEVAKIAEEYDVELFAPLGEAGKFFSGNGGEWRQEILPRIREVYHGEIFSNEPGVGLPDKETISKIPEEPPGHFSGYDYIGFCILFLPSEDMTPEERLRYADRLTLEDYSQYVEGALDYMLALAERDNCKGVIITEFGVLGRVIMTESGVVDRLGEDWLSEEEFTRTHEIVLEKGKDRVVGFIAGIDILEVEFGEIYIRGIPETQEVIRRWYTEVL